MKKRVTIIVAFHFMKRRLKSEVALWIHLKIFEKSPTNPKKGAGKSHSAEQFEREPSCFAVVLYFMLEALDAFKIKY